MPLFLSAPHPPALVARGLYAGLKSRGGLPTPLPVALGSELYVNAGFIDGLSAPLMRSLGLTDVQIRLIGRGPLLMQWYYLDRHGSIRHYVDQTCNPSDPSIPTSHDLDVPPVLLCDENVSLIYFRISQGTESEKATASELMDWCFHTNHKLPNEPRPLLLVSRSLGESGSLIAQHQRHQLHLADLKQRFPDLRFLPLPCLHLYESDEAAYQRSSLQLRDFATAHPELESTVVLYHNPFNLGGGGNMCLAIQRSVIDSQHHGDFVMLDSDTLVPFKTFYTSALISELNQDQSQSASVMIPVIAYRKRPTTVLEAGALFGRGTWQLGVSQPLQPCIFPLENGSDLSDKHVQGRLAQTQSSDYPPFIYSLYRLGNSVSAHSLLPAPFFLRGDDVEYGFHLRGLGIKTSVQGSLLVFQDPKHSPWHEVMAILHSFIILIAYTKKQDLELLEEHMKTYLDARLNAHASIRDLHGISLYQEVLDRLLSLLDIAPDHLLSHFYNPDYYRQIRSLNTPYSDLNYNLAKKLKEGMPDHAFWELPFLYFPAVDDHAALPESIFLVNHLAETAAVLHPRRVERSEIQSTCKRFRSDLTKLLVALEPLQQCCLTLLKRDQIRDIYHQHYSHRNDLETQNGSCHNQSTP